jgi:hypothetical protein
VRWSSHGCSVFALQLAWKLSGDKTNMELKEKVIKDIAAENNIMVDFSEFPGVISQDSSGVVPHRNEFNHVTGPHR